MILYLQQCTECEGDMDAACETKLMHYWLLHTRAMSIVREIRFELLDFYLCVCFRDWDSRLVQGKERPER